MFIEITNIELSNRIIELLNRWNLYCPTTVAELLDDDLYDNEEITDEERRDADIDADHERGRLHDIWVEGGPSDDDDER